MKTSRASRLTAALLVLLVCSGCQTVTVEHTVETTDYVTERKKDTFLTRKMESPTPAQAMINIDDSFYENREGAFEQAIAYGNYFLDEWANKQQAAMVANRLAWASVFCLKPINTRRDDLFDQFEYNLYNYCRAGFYISLSQKYDSPADEYYWTRRGNIFLLLLEEGYEDEGILFAYLEAEKYAMIEAPKNRDISYLEKSLQLVEDIRARAPGFLPEIMEGSVEEKQESLRLYYGD